MPPLTREAAMIFADILREVLPDDFGDLSDKPDYWEAWCQKSCPPNPWEGILDALSDTNASVRDVFNKFCQGPVPGVTDLALAARHQKLRESLGDR
jgi:hypothetical protein